MAQKARREVEAKVKKAKRRRVAEKKKKKKRMLEYLQQLWSKVLEEKAALLKSTEEFQITRPKYKETSLETDANCWPFKKAKRKQPVRY